jgi:hypothetical protein
MLIHALNVFGTALGLYDAKKIGLELGRVAITASLEKSRRLPWQNTQDQR